MQDDTKAMLTVVQGFCSIFATLAKMKKKAYYCCLIWKSKFAPTEAIYGYVICAFYLMCLCRQYVAKILQNPVCIYEEQQKAGVVGGVVRRCSCH